VDEAKFLAAERLVWDLFDLAPTTRRCRLPRLGVTVRIQEVGAGPPVLFLHGGSNSGTSWAPIAPHLTGFRAIFLDRPGCGLSDTVAKRLDAAGLREVADTLVVDVLDALELERSHLVATSLGGFTALRSAAVHPERIDRMVLFGWPVGAPVGRLPLFMRFASAPVLASVAASVKPNEGAVRAMLRRIGLGHAMEEGKFTEVEVDCYLALLRYTDTFRNEVHTGRYLSTGGLREGLLIPDEVLAAVKAPTHLLWGEDDIFGGPELARRFASRLPNAELELLPDAGHVVWVDWPEYSAEVTRRFLLKENQPIEDSG
jgi:2-hydroxy-6-oxonona-2,4-dienedioate hydrolase